MRLFNLVREYSTPIAPAGVVAQIVEFDNGKVVTCWITGIASVVMWDNIDDARKVHAGAPGSLLVEVSIKG